MRAEQGSQVCCTFPLLAFKCPIIQDNLEAKIVLSSQQRLCLCSVTLDSGLSDFYGSLSAQEFL